MATGAFPDGRTPVVLSAHGDGLLGQDAAAILAYLDGHRTVADVADVASTLHRTRRLRRHRAVVRAADITELREGLGALAASDDHPLVTRATAPGRTAERGRTAFVFPGQGSQWPSMGVDAYARLREYRAEVDTCATVFASLTSASPLEYLLADPAADVRTNDFSQVQIQGAQFVHGVALARVWRAAGVLPDIVVGHSLGELGAAYVAGTITLAAAVGVVIARATLLDRLTGPYRVAVLGITPAQAQDVIAVTPGWLELSVVNSKSSVAVSGDSAAVAAAVRTVSERGSFAKEIEMWFPAHTTALDSMRAELEALLPTGEFADAAVEFIGSATADVVKPGTPFADYWYANLRSTVRFDRAVGAAVAHGARTFVEMSAHPALLFAMDEVLDDLPDVAEGTTTVVGSGSRGEPIVDRLSANIAAIALTDSAHRWVGEPRKPLPDFPFAPMHGDQLWALPEPLPPIAGITVALEHWERVPTLVPDGHRRVALFDAGADARLADSLRAAIHRHSGFVIVEPADADVFVVIAPQFEHGDAVRAAEQLSERIERDLFGYTTAITPGCRDVWLVTVGAERTQPCEPVARPAPAALAAMHRSVGLEYPDQRFGHLDLPVAERADAELDAAVAVLLGDAAVVTVRHGDSGAAVYRRSMRDAGPRPPSWSADSGVLDDVVVTGGGGAIGMHYARALAERGARRVVLLSRGGADAAALVRLTEAHGTEFVAPRCDLTDASQLAAVAAKFAGGGASLVIHAAGAATIVPHRDLTSAAARDTFAAKVIGLHHLTHVWPLRPEARILLCSSVSGLWGGRGHAVYSAANRLLDVMAERLRAEGRNCTAVRWGLWQDTGIIDAEEIARVERSGLLAMRPERAAEVSLRDHAGDPMVFSADTDRLGAFLEPDQIATAVRDAPESEATVRDAGTTMRAALGAVLKLPDTTGLDLDTSLLDLGVDSLLAVELKKRLKKATGRTVPLATILGGATATELIEHLESPEKKALIRD
ncbi:MULTISPECIES: mycobactin polyketide synthase MbtD [unclassified Mycobacterium]|uniref:mycobactin polyketide synthase MbtD n=1 Tax=unclassified Mycobacterium TaxID=2642494 RepID=UPI0029C63392|nr:MULTISPECIES: mycobactin polyketide synthase MbtD [unclassified Mycobacterium]